MNSVIKYFQDAFNNHQLQMRSKLLDEIYQKFTIFYITKIEDSQIINDLQNEIKIIIIDSMKYNDEEYAIICFEQTIIIITKLNISWLENFFANHNDSKLIRISDKDDSNLPKYIKIDDQESDEMIEIYNFIEGNERGRFLYYFNLLSPSNKAFNKILHVLRRIILVFIVKKSYLKMNTNRLSNFDANKKPEIKEYELNDSNFIKIKNLGASISSAELIYHIGLEQLLAMKIFYDVDRVKLFKREKRNYEMICHPLIPKFYGIGKINGEERLLIEYIKGSSLSKISEMNLNKEEKISIIYELLKIIEYLHHNRFIYRDMRPDNFIIDENKMLVLIDFDRMLLEDDEKITKDLSSIYIAPEVSEYNRYSYEVDIYSLGLIIYFIVMEKEAPKEFHSRNIFDDFSDDFCGMSQIFKNCINIDGSTRPVMNEIIQDFLKYYSPSIKNFNNLKQIETQKNNNSTLKIKEQENCMNLDLFKGNAEISTKKENKTFHNNSKPEINFKDQQAQFNRGRIYQSGEYIRRDINKAIHYYSLAANQNDPQAQFILGVIYHSGEYMTRDINKAIHYYSLAANQNYPQAQFFLGVIYHSGEYIRQDINKAIHYYSLAANQNYPQAQFNLGVIYHSGEYMTRDINKAIHYFSLAANQNDPQAQFILGVIYYSSEYIRQDINKAIHYFSLAANQNIPQAQFNLGRIYHSGEYIRQDINKAIHYYSLAANQNYPQAQFHLGRIYHSGEYITRDINKAIHYYSLAANQNDPQAQFILGLIYQSGEYIRQDINKAIHYYSLAANQNYPQAQFHLGRIYHSGEYMTRDINKAIHYYSLAANQNYPQAQFHLGRIYHSGEYMTRDINKAIHYYSLAANQNIPQAQFILGVIYHSGEYMTRDINKAIHYFSLAANQNIPQAQFNLGVIYHSGEYIRQDINKAIHYYSLAANQNIPQAQFNLGVIYHSGEYITRDINKAIHYYSLAANQNDPQAQYNLGSIYQSGEYITRDINKAIHYYSLAANQNYPQAQYNLGSIYQSGEYITRDINKAIHYYSLAANQNYPQAQFILGVIYHSGEYMTRDINKAIHYYSLAANQNYPQAQFHLGRIYHSGEYIRQDINKAIHYYSLAANQNIPQAQFNLGLMYHSGEYITRDINKAIHYFSLAANQNDPQAKFIIGLFHYNGEYFKKNANIAIRYFSFSAAKGNIGSHFALGVIYSQGIYIERNFEEAIHHYNNGSNLYDNHSKNNLGIIYKYNDYKNKYPIEYFKEAIRDKNDIVSMYNLGHIYFYGEKASIDIDESIKLLIRSLNGGFKHSKILLCLVLIKKITKSKITKETIDEEINKAHEKTGKLTQEILNTIQLFYLYNDIVYEYFYSEYKNIDFTYNINCIPIKTSDFFEKLTIIFMKELVLTCYNKDQKMFGIDKKSTKMSQNYFSLMVHFTVFKDYMVISFNKKLVKLCQRNTFIKIKIKNINTLCH